MGGWCSCREALALGKAYLNTDPHVRRSPHLPQPGAAGPDSPGAGVRGQPGRAERDAGRAGPHDRQGHRPAGRSAGGGARAGVEHGPPARLVAGGHGVRGRPRTVQGPAPDRHRQGRGPARRVACAPTGSRCSPRGWSARPRSPSRSASSRPPSRTRCGSTHPRRWRTWARRIRAELLACVRAHGLPETEAAVPRSLDRYGLELAAIGADGIRTVRLPFPGGPVRSLQEVTDGLRVLLTCRCGTCRHRSREG